MKRLLVGAALQINYPPWNLGSSVSGGGHVVIVFLLLFLLC